MNSKHNFPFGLSEHGVASLLWGFGKSIDQLKLPRLQNLKDAAKEIGLVVMTQDEYDKLTSPKPTNHDNVKAILASQLNDAEKLKKIVELVK